MTFVVDLKKTLLGMAEMTIIGSRQYSSNVTELLWEPKYFFFQKRFIYLKDGVIQREGETVIFHLLFHSPDGPGRSRDLCLGLLFKYRSSSIWGIVCSFPKYIAGPEVE